MVDTGADRSGIAINRLAFIAEAIKAEEGDDAPSAKEPSAETLQNLIRAWRRYQRERYPADTRPQAEFAVQFWGSVLMRSFPEEFLTADLSRLGDLPPTVDKETLRTVLSNNAEFQSALQALYPGIQAARLPSLPQLPEIGPRIGCMCMLSYVTLKEELADFFITRLNRWQQTKIELPMCRRDLIPRMQTSVRPSLLRIQWLANEQVMRARAALKASSVPTSDMQEAVDKANQRYQRATAALKQAQRDVDEVQKAIVRKRETIAKAEEICYMTQKPVPPVPQVSQAASAATEAAPASSATPPLASDPKPEEAKQ
jgi:hypothetical protein